VHGVACLNAANGDFYIAEIENHRIRKVSATGIVTTVTGNGSPGYAGDGGLVSPMKMFPMASIATPVG
jgi:hypothetical protein